MVNNIARMAKLSTNPSKPIHKNLSTTGGFGILNLNTLKVAGGFHIKKKTQ